MTQNGAIYALDTAAISLWVIESSGEIPLPLGLTFTHIFGGVSSSTLNYGRVKWRKWRESG